MDPAMAYKWATTFALAFFACAASDNSPPAAGNPDAAAMRLDAAGPLVDAHIDPPAPDGAPASDAALGPAADPAQPGPFAAGVRTVMMTDPSRNRTFAVDIWYPVDPATGGGRANQYQLQALGLTLASLSTPARRDGTPAAGGPWPLVIFSHGYGGVRFQSFFLTEQLATHGFVVAAPDHPGNTMADLILGGGDATQSSIDRPLDVLFVLEKMLAGTSGVAVTVDGSRVG